MIQKCPGDALTSRGVVETRVGSLNVESLPQDFNLVKCACGCGQPAPIAKKTDRRRGTTKGKPSRFVHGHSGRKYWPGSIPIECACGCGGVLRVPDVNGEMHQFLRGHSTRSASFKERVFVPRRHVTEGPQNGRYKGHRTVTSAGYISIRVPNGSAKDQGGGYGSEHRVVMSRILGRELTRDEVVHHINGQKSDNRPENLVVMTNHEHLMLHARMKREAKSGATWTQTPWGKE